MARFTISDCLEKINNRFTMTLVAAIRAQQINNGNKPLLENNKSNKAAVLALREISKGLISENILNKDNIDD